MRQVILDIGAGSLYFARRLWWRNWFKQQIIFCGEPRWNRRWGRTVDSASIRDLIHRDVKGIFRVVSEYGNFDFDDASLDMVTLNAPHIMIPPTWIEKELVRCLKSGGIFFFSYPVEFGLPSFPDGTFTLLTRKSFTGTTLIDLAEIPGFPAHLPNKIVASRVMKYNIDEGIRRRDPSYRNPMGNSYVYRGIPLCNMYEVWQKL